MPIIQTIKTNTNSKIHIHRNKAIRNYLSLLGIEEDRLIYGYVKSENVVLMDRVECTSSIYKNSVIELRELLLKKIKRKNIINKNTILFIKRLYSRRIKNFDSIVSRICSIYNDYICEIYKPNTNFNMMINMFTQADLIFGPHGAGFTNIILSKKEVIILELIRKDLPVLCFATLSNILGYKYYGVYSKYNRNKEEFDMNITTFINYFNEFNNIINSYIKSK